MVAPPTGKKKKTEGFANSKQLTSEYQQQSTQAGAEDLRGKKITQEHRSEILSQVFFEGEVRVPYVKQFYLLISLASIIATFGLMRNSPSVVIGAMLISPLMTPILGVSTSLVMGWPKRAGRVTIRLIFATLYGFSISYLILAVFQIPTDIVIPPEIIARTNPKLAELAVGLCAGIAAAYMLVHKETSFALPGVAISVALVPPLCVSGILAYFREYNLAWQAFILYSTNLVAIILTASSVLLFSGFMPDRKNIALYFRVTVGMITAVLIVVLVAIPLTARTLDDFRDAHDRRIAISVVREWIGKNSAEIVDVEIEDNLLQVFLRINLPMESLYKREHLATNANLGKEMTLESLKQSLTAVIGKEVNVTLKGSFAFWESTCPVPEDCYY